ncbi:kinase-like domain-containing protein [Syncephalis pseudoplumigaleata]|uniref:Kinase-like domain-containing protein n=1 Tax=Syncephalis pseudoplumigaleata TaxID=1712513 RepID=A0A4P9Z3J1_9FUNG|nr:kinase-like domain-containing protein [Syncephalis pseudoplumigaleata]|eukprot:RKP26582.1 kinase-like domain-containing protein [Syncephalis pseudoplumigaleata]
MVAGVSYLHCIGLGHLDIKPENILLYNPGGSEPLVKIIDYGIMADIRKKAEQPVFCATIGYCAPEIFAKDGPIDLTTKLAIVHVPTAVAWSVGATMYTYLASGMVYPMMNYMNGAGRVVPMGYRRYGEWFVRASKDGAHLDALEELASSDDNTIKQYHIKELAQFMVQLMQSDPNKRSALESSFYKQLEPFVRDKNAAGPSTPRLASPSEK